MLHLAQRIYNLLDEVAASDKTYILVAHNGIARVVQSYFYEMTNEEYAAFFGEHKPGRVIVSTTTLHFGCLVEIEAIAEMPAK